MSALASLDVDKNDWTIGSLFSGACDGLSLGLEWAGLGPTIWQVEYEADRRANLARHWPDADRAVYDVRDAGRATLPRPGIIVCSAPCQDLSGAGKKAGLDGARSGLWYEGLRCISELRPDWVVVENVASGARNWVPHVREGLGRFGYATFPVPLAASNLGAPHERGRVFVVAHLDGGGEPVVPVNAEASQASGHVSDAHQVGTQQQEPRRARALQRPELGSHAGWPTELAVVPRSDGVPSRVVRWLGDSVVPQCAEVVGWVIRELAS